MGWVTIGGNHVLLDDDGRSLCDSSLSHKSDRSSQRENLNESETRSRLKEEHEAQKAGMRWREFKISKLGIKELLLSELENIAPAVRDMSSDGVRQFLNNWWKTQIKESDDPMLKFYTPDLTVIGAQYVASAQGGQSEENTLKDNVLAPIKTIGHFVKRTGSPLDIDIKEAKISSKDIADSPDVKKLLEQNPNATKIDFNNQHIGIHTSGWRQTYLGHITLSLKGTLSFDNNGEPRYEGYISAMPDENDYEKSKFRNPVDETATTVMRTIGKAAEAKSFKIRIRGAQYLNE